MRRIFWRAGAVVALLAAAHAAPAFENPLTARPSKDINSWLLGVWETRDDKGEVLARVTVLPRTGDSCWVNAERVRPKKESARFVGWISRVGPASFLTLQSVGGSAGPVGPGEYAFAHYQVLDQRRVRVRLPALQSPAGATSYQLRKELRALLKAGAAFDGPGTEWERVSEVYWSGTDENQPFQPLRFPAGAER